jgi:hypothetical protein
MHPLNAHLAELSESSVILVLLPKLTTEVLSLCTPCTSSMPTWQSFTEILRASVCNCVSSHSLASKVFNNLEVFPELLISVLVPQHVFV